MPFEQNYTPDPRSDVLVGSCSSGPLLTGSGAPNCAGYEGQPWLDKDSGDIYQYQSGSWVLIASGGGGAGGQQSFYLEPGDDPTVLGLVPANSAGNAYDLAGNFWTYSDGAWVKIISA